MKIHKDITRKDVIARKINASKIIVNVYKQEQFVLIYANAKIAKIIRFQKNKVCVNLFHKKTKKKSKKN